MKEFTALYFSYLAIILSITKEVESINKVSIVLVLASILVNAT